MTESHGNGEGSILLSSLEASDSKSSSSRLNKVFGHNYVPQTVTGRRVATTVVIAVALLGLGAVVTSGKSAAASSGDSSSGLWQVWVRGFDYNFNPVTDKPGMEGWLDCSVYDDDLVYPSQAGCYSNDWGVYCNTSIGEGSTCYSDAGTCYLQDELCSWACLKQGSNFGLVCMHQAVASLRETCSNSFVPSLPAGQNLGPSNKSLAIGTYDSALREGNAMTQATVGYGSESDPCAYHAFCSSCMTGNASSQWKTNEGCWEAAVIESKDMSYSQLAVQLVIQKLDFYCQSDILKKFESGELSDLLKEDGGDAEIRKRYLTGGSTKYVFPTASAATSQARKELCIELAGSDAEELC